MSIYRENAVQVPETVLEFPVSTRRGHALVVTLGTIATLLFSGWAAGKFGGAPPALRPWIVPMGIASAIALVAAIVVHVRRRRTLAIVRTGDAHHLIIERENLRIAFPLGISGDQMKKSIRGIPLYEVWLKLVDANGRGGIFLQETRGAIHGAQHGWLGGIDRSVECERFESGRVGMLAELREVVETINARARSAGVESIDART